MRAGTNERRLRLYGDECMNVFLVSGSFEERDKYAGEILDDQTCRIVLCSVQYTEAVRKTFDYVVERDFDMAVQWLNPGYSDRGESFDRLGLTAWLIGHDASVSKRDGKAVAVDRVEDIRQFVHGWAKRRGLTYACPS